jgi:hypothetical protein
MLRNTPHLLGGAQHPGRSSVARCAAPGTLRQRRLTARNISPLAKVAATGQKKLDTKKRQRRTI